MPSLQERRQPSNGLRRTGLLAGSNLRHAYAERLPADLPQARAEAMGIDRCSKCERYVDTDADVDCYLPVNERDYRCVCEPCRASMGESGECEDDPRHGQSADINRSNRR